MWTVPTALQKAKNKRDSQCIKLFLIILWLSYLFTLELDTSIVIALLSFLTLWFIRSREVDNLEKIQNPRRNMQ